MKNIIISLTVFILFMSVKAFADEGFIARNSSVTKVVSGGMTLFAFDVTGGTGPCTERRLRFSLDNSAVDSETLNRAFTLITTALVTKNKVDIWANDLNNCDSGWSVDLHGE